jgi:hypothetical protein
MSGPSRSFPSIAAPKAAYSRVYRLDTLLRNHSYANEHRFIARPSRLGETSSNREFDPPQTTDKRRRRRTNRQIRRKRAP